MTPAEQEVTLIELWNQGLEITVIAQRLGIPKGTVQSRAHRLQQRGLIQPWPRGGTFSRQRALARQEGTLPPAYPPGKAMRWNLWILDAMRDELATLATERGISPSQLVQELLWKELRRE